MTLTICMKYNMLLCFFYHCHCLLYSLTLGDHFIVVSFVFAIKSPRETHFRIPASLHSSRRFERASDTCGTLSCTELSRTHNFDTLYSRKRKS